MKDTVISIKMNNEYSKNSQLLRPESVGCFLSIYLTNCMLFEQHWGKL